MDLKARMLKRLLGVLFQMSSLAILKAAFAGVAQLVEQLICNQPVAGSSPVTSFSLETFLGQMFGHFYLINM